ncbi:MAG: iron-only hydrogenase system regulator [Firmicutes bacterium]|jgi:putative iron-only hydrogenase system regulator|nr:iron-only hydrogenase system regulator [Bacillota bacterium]
MSENRIAAVSIIVSDRSASEKINAALSAYGEYILGRMGIPYKEKGVSVLSVVLDAPVEITNALTGKLGKIENVSVKALFGKL